MTDQRDQLLDEYELLVGFYFQEAEDKILKSKKAVESVDSGETPMDWTYDMIKNCIHAMECKQLIEMNEHLDTITNPELPFNRNKMRRFLDHNGEKYRKMVCDV